MYDFGSIVLTRFPFTDLSAAKVRPCSSQGYRMWVLPLVVMARYNGPSSFRCNAIQGNAGITLLRTEQHHLDGPL
ncbi:MAG: hypothetical protein P4L57_13665 [Rhizomicrobium sp.]|nr:hypothetical protein [Rhizomicrobium sp.]